MRRRRRGAASGGKNVADDTPAPDMVHHPPHYTQGGIECIDALAAALGEEGFRAHCRGNAIKYLWRGPHKGTAVQDYEKAQWYIDRLITSLRQR